MYVDLLAQTARNSNTDVAQMGLTFQYAAPLAGAYGYEIDDVALAIGAMANAGIKGEKAGTALRKIFTETIPQLKEFGIETTNADGSMRDLGEVLVELRGSFANLTREQKISTAETLAGKTGMAGLLAIVNATEKDFNKLAGAISNSAGAAREMAKVKLDNLQGDLKKLRSILEDIGISIFDKLNKPFRKAIQEITEEFDVLSDGLRSGAVSITRAFASVVAKVVDMATEMMPPFIDGVARAIPELIERINTIVPKMIDALMRFLPSLTDSAINIVIALANGISKNLPLLIQKIPEIIGILGSSIERNLPQLIKVGGEIIAGLVKGIVNMLPELWRVVTDIAGAIITTFKKVLRINSPSVKGIAVGEDTVNGVVEGLKNKKKDAKKAAEDVAKTIEENIKLDMDKLKAFADAVVQALKASYQESANAAKEAIETRRKSEEAALESTFKAEEKALEKSIKQQLDSAKKKKDAAVNAINEQNKAQEKAFAEQIKIQTKALDEQLKAEEKASQQRIKVYDQEFSEKLKLIDYEAYLEIKALEDQIGQIDAIIEAEAKAAEEQEYILKRTNLQNAIATAENSEDKQKAIEELAKFEKDRQEKLIAEQRKTQKEALKEQINAVKEAAEQKKEALQAEKEAFVQNENEKLEAYKVAHEKEKEALQNNLDEQLEALKKANEEKKAEIEESQEQILESLKESLDEEKEQLKESQRQRSETVKKGYDDELKESEKHFANLLSTENLNAEARKLILEKNNDEVLKLLQTYNPKWQDAGQSLTDSLINGLNSENQSMEDAIKEAFTLESAITQQKSQLDMLKKQIDDFKDDIKGGSGGGGGGAGGGDQYEMYKKAFKESGDVIDEEEQRMLNSIATKGEEKKSKVQDINNQIEKIYQEAAKNTTDGVVQLTTDQIAELERLYKEYNDIQDRQAKIDNEKNKIKRQQVLDDIKEGRTNLLESYEEILVGVQDKESKAIESAKEVHAEMLAIAKQNYSEHGNWEQFVKEVEIANNQLSDSVGKAKTETKEFTDTIINSKPLEGAEDYWGAMQLAEDTRELEIALGQLQKSGLDTTEVSNKLNEFKEKMKEYEYFDVDLLGKWKFIENKGLEKAAEVKVATDNVADASSKGTENIIKSSMSASDQTLASGKLEYQNKVHDYYVNTLLGTKGDVEKASEDVTDGLATGMQFSAPKVLLKAMELAGTITNPIRDKISDMQKAGEDLTGGLNIGLESGMPTIIAKSAELALGILDTMRTGLDEHSPSKKAIEIAEFFGDGIVNGLNSSINNVVTAVTGLVSKILEGFKPATDFFTITVPTAIEDMLIKFDEFKQKVSEIWTEIVKGVNEKIDEIVKFFKETVPNAIEDMKKKYEDFKKDISTIWTEINDWIKDKVESIKKFFTETIPNAIEEMKKKFDEFKQNIQNIWKEIYDWIKEKVDKIVEFFKVTVPNAINEMKNKFDGFKQEFSNIISSIKDKIDEWKNKFSDFVNIEVPKFISDIETKFKELPVKILQVGKDLVTGLWNGISSMTSWLGGKISGFVSETLAAFKGKQGFDEHSPSKKTTEIGEYAGKGIGIGIAKSLSFVLNEVTTMVGAISDEMSELENGDIEFSPKMKDTGVVSQLEVIEEKLRKIAFSFGENLFEGVKSKMPMIERELLDNNYSININRQVAQIPQTSNIEIINNYKGLFDGAEIVIRSEMDLESIANAVSRNVGTRYTQSLRGRGIR